jgi:hypothetical protein
VRQRQRQRQRQRFYPNAEESKARLVQPESELRVRKSKKKPRKNACIVLDSLGRIGAFQRVAANPNKKI